MNCGIRDVMREKHYVERNGKLYARAYYKDPKTGKWKQVWRKVDSKTQAREVARTTSRNNSRLALKRLRIRIL